MSFARNRVLKVYSMMPSGLVRDMIRSANLWCNISLYTRDVRSVLLFWYDHPTEIEAEVELEFLAGLLKCVLETENLEGNIIELGTYKGGSTLLMAYLLKITGSKRRIYACDTFKGHPYGDKFLASNCNNETLSRPLFDFSDTSARYVEKKFRAFGVADRITLVKGRFEDILAKRLGRERFSLAFADCDLYDSAKYALKFLYPRMTLGEKIVLHDYGNRGWGLTKAVDEWCEREGIEVNSYRIGAVANPRFPWIETRDRKQNEQYPCV